jgi:hypothetical protein
LFIQDGDTKIDANVDRDTVELARDQMENLFGKAKSTLPEHLFHLVDEEIESFVREDSRVFQVIRNKLLRAINSQTAAELVRRRQIRGI